MKKIIFICSFILFILSNAFSGNNLHYKINTTILVEDPEQAGIEISKWIRENGGYILTLSEMNIIVLFPGNKNNLLREFLESISMESHGFSITAVDNTEEIMTLNSGISAREEVLKRNLEFLDKVDVKGTLALEQEVWTLIEEIEKMKGRLRKLVSESRFGRAEIMLSFYSQQLTTNIQSSFSWINTIDFYQLVSEGF